MGKKKTKAAKPELKEAAPVASKPEKKPEAKAAPELRKFAKLKALKGKK